MGLDKFVRNLGIHGIKGASKWRGITTITSGTSIIAVTATAAASGYPVLTGLNATSVASHRDIVLSVNSVVVNTSFCIVADKATVNSQEVYYVIVR